jgi:hypothetical protein
MRKVTALREIWNRNDKTVVHDQHLNVQRLLTVVISTISAAASLSGAHATLHAMLYSH